jgi:hypothetical protein
MTLGYSRKSVRLLVFRSSSRIWAELHEKAFRRLGGSVRVVVLDNLREGVIGLHDSVVGAGLSVLRSQQSGGHSTKHDCNRHEPQCLIDLTQITSSERKDRLRVCPACLSNFRVPRPLLG